MRPRGSSLWACSWSLLPGSKRHERGTARPSYVPGQSPSPRRRVGPIASRAPGPTTHPTAPARGDCPARAYALRHDRPNRPNRRGGGVAVNPQGAPATVDARDYADLYAIACTDYDLTPEDRRALEHI